MRSARWRCESKRRALLLSPPHRRPLSQLLQRLVGLYAGLKSILIRSDRVNGRAREHVGRVKRAPHGACPPDQRARCILALHGKSTMPGTVIVVSQVAEYRRHAHRSIDPDMDVLEIGCSTGLATRLLARHAHHVFAVDITEQMVERAAAAVAPRHNVSFATLDGRDIVALLAFASGVQAIFIDLGGNGPLETAVHTTRQCLAAFKPRLLVVRNESLADLASMIHEATPPDDPRDRAWERPFGTTELLEHLLVLSQSSWIATRMVAARRLAELSMPRARARLEAMLQDPSPRVRRMVTTSLSSRSFSHDRIMHAER